MDARSRKNGCPVKNYGVKAHAVVHTQTAKVYFYPGETSVNYHKKRIEELSQTAQ